MKKLRVLLLPVSLLLSVPYMHCNQTTENTVPQNECSATELANTLQANVEEYAENSDSIEFSFRLFKAEQHDKQAWLETIQNAVNVISEMDNKETSFLNDLKKTFAITDEDESAQKGIHGEMRFAINCDSCGGQGEKIEEKEPEEEDCGCSNHKYQSCACIEKNADGTKGVCMCATRFPDTGCTCVKAESCTK